MQKPKPSKYERRESWRYESPVFGLGSSGGVMRLLLDYFPGVEVWHWNGYGTGEQLVDGGEWFSRPAAGPGILRHIQLHGEHVRSAGLAAELARSLHREAGSCDDTRCRTDRACQGEEPNRLRRLSPALPSVRPIPERSSSRGGIVIRMPDDASRWPSKRN